MNETIAAIATPQAVGGISVIRISGDEAFAVADRIFESIYYREQESIMDQIAIWFASTLGQYISKAAVVFIISMIPILELRVGLLVAIPLCIIGNIIPIPFILLFIKQIFKWLKKIPFCEKIVTKLENRAMGKSDSIKRYEFWGLALFVGIPLPGTGAWTGSLIAALLEIDFKKAVLSELIGIAMATIIMSIVSYGLLGLIL